MDLQLDRRKAQLAIDVWWKRRNAGGRCKRRKIRKECAHIRYIMEHNVTAKGRDRMTKTWTVWASLAKRGRLHFIASLRWLEMCLHPPDGPYDMSNLHFGADPLSDAEARALIRRLEKGEGTRYEQITDVDRRGA